MKKFTWLCSPFIIQGASYFIFRMFADNFGPFDHFFFGWVACAIADGIVEVLKIKRKWI